MSNLVDGRPVRDAFEDITGKVPSGPLGKLGDGNVVGGLGYLAVESGEIVTIPVPGATRPGFKYVSHSFISAEGDVQRYEIVVHAISKDVAEFAVQYKAAPSNIDFLRGESSVVGTEVLDEDRTYSTYKITVEVDRSEIRDTVNEV